MRTTLRTLVTAVAAAVLTSLAAAQNPCTPVSGSGCPGATPPSCGGSVALGSTLDIICITSGRTAVSQTVFLGACAPAPVQLPTPLTCGVNPCNLIVSLGAFFSINTGFQTLSIPIPNRPLLVGQTLCFQCLELLSPPGCIQVSEAMSVTITL